MCYNFFFFRPSGACCNSQQAFKGSVIHTLKGTVYYVLIISQPNCYFSQKTKARGSGGFGHYKILPLNSFFFLLLLWPLFHWKQQVVTLILSMCLHLPAVFLLWKINPLINYILVQQYTMPKNGLESCLFSFSGQWLAL